MYIKFHACTIQQVKIKSLIEQSSNVQNRERRRIGIRMKERGENFEGQIDKKETHTKM